MESSKYYEFYSINGDRRKMYVEDPNLSYAIKNMRRDEFQFLLKEKGKTLAGPYYKAIGEISFDEAKKEREVITDEHSGMRFFKTSRDYMYVIDPKKSIEIGGKCNIK